MSFLLAMVSVFVVGVLVFPVVRITDNGLVLFVVVGFAAIAACSWLL